MLRPLLLWASENVWLRERMPRLPFVRRAVRDVFEAFGKVGLVLGPASSVHPMMPWENTLAMLDEWRKLRDA